jgi:LmbE family N-acetylglucosaminyl deacetylase
MQNEKGGAMNILFVGAHPDDIETFAGGTAARYRECGDNLFFCVATNGNVGSSTLPPDEIAAIRHQEAKAGATVLGAELIWLDFDDEFLMDSRKTRLAFINAFRIANPDVVFCHWLNDYNPDHSISGSIVHNCIHMAKIPNIKTTEPPIDKDPHVYHMDTPMGLHFDPTIYVDITATFSTKVEMVKKHASQSQWMVDMFGLCLEEFLEIPAKLRGLQCGVKMAEAFRPSIRFERTFRRHYLPDCLEPLKL